jgi:inner membrane protein
MDLFSHALLPYLLGNYFKKKKEEITAFVIGGIAPDVDIFLLLIQYLYPTFFLITHRGITHSLFFGFFTGVFVLYIASRKGIKKRVQKYFNFEPVFTQRTILYAYAGVLLHLFLDYSTSGGVPLFYPFETTRYSAELFFYTDIYLTIVSLVMVIYLFKKPFQSRTITKFLLIFLIVFAGLGVLRFAEKNNSQEFFNDVNIQSFPTMNPFTWYAQKEDVDKITIFEYDGLEGRSDYNMTVPRLNILSAGEGFDKALAAADQLPQAKMFRWRAHTVAFNASYGNGTWSLEYFDPVQRIEMRSISGTFMRAGTRLSSLNVNVTGERAVAEN